MIDTTTAINYAGSVRRAVEAASNDDDYVMPDDVLSMSADLLDYVIAKG